MTTPTQQVQTIINTYCTDLQNWMETELQKFNSGSLSKSQVQSDFTAESSLLNQALGTSITNLAGQYSNSSDVWSAINAANPWGVYGDYVASIQSQTINAIWNGTTPVIPPVPGGSSSQAQAIQNQIAILYSTAKTAFADYTTLQKDFQTLSSEYLGLSSSQQEPFSSQMSSLTSQMQALPTSATLQSNLNDLSTLNTEAMQTTDLTTLDTYLTEAGVAAKTFPSDTSVQSLDASVNTLSSQMQSTPTPTPTPSITLTTVSIKGKDFYINGQITHPNTPQQGMLPNSRMIQGVFDDANPTTVSKWVYPDTKKWDPNRNTQELCNAIPSYKSRGLLAITVGFQGGSPIAGQYAVNQPWTNTAYNRDGSLKASYLGRMDKIIRTLDKNGMVLILNLFYAGQQNRLSSDLLVTAAVDNVTDWIVSQGYTNVMVCIANESSASHFPDHPILQPNNVYQLINRMKTRGKGKFLVTANVDVVVSSVIQAGDFVIIHTNTKTASQIPSYIQSYRAKTSKPIVINEDSTNITKYQTAVSAGASWGYYDQGQNNYVDGYQSPPVNWGVNTTKKKAFFNEVATLSK